LTPGGEVSLVPDDTEDALTVKEQPREPEQKEKPKLSTDPGDRAQREAFVDTDVATVARQPVKALDYDNMLILHYLSGKKLIVMVNPGKKKSIAPLINCHV